MSKNRKDDRTATAKLIVSLARRGLSAVIVASVALAAAVRAEEKPLTDRDLGILYGETEAAREICSTLQLDLAARNGLIVAARIDIKSPPTAFKEGVSEAEKSSAEAIANERLRSFCLDMLRRYGPDGERARGLMQKK